MMAALKESHVLHRLYNACSATVSLYELKMLLTVSRRESITYLRLVNDLYELQSLFQDPIKYSYPI